MRGVLHECAAKKKKRKENWVILGTMPQIHVTKNDVQYNGYKVQNEFYKQ